MPWTRAAFFALATMFSVFPNSTAWADCEAGFEAFDSTDYEQALRHLLPCARSGDPAAQFEVGVLYEFGRGVPRDDAEAIRWYHLAADQGIVEAQFNLGAKYAKGEGVSQDDAKAVHWFRRAAEHGDAGAQYNLAVRYYYGEGTLQDDMSAYMWSNLAAARLPQGELRDRAVDLRDDAAARLSPAERARGQELARNWQPRLAARTEGGSLAYAGPEKGEPPRTQRQVEQNPFRVALERQARETQQLLAALGYDPGPADGVIGPRTRAAVRAFQADAGLPVDGKTSDELRAALTDALSTGQRVAARSAPAQRRLNSSGTSFAVSQDGHLLTNHHVVADCAEVRVQPQAMEAAAAVIVARDPTNDLALLEASVSLPALAYLDDRGIRAGDSVVAVGFPLPGLLASEANVTTGTVSALAGIGNDVRLLQVTVPVQPGNSGGPLLDLPGRVVGIVVGKLDAVQVASVTGDIPQNVNFAIKAGVAQTFLEASGVAGRGVPTVEEAHGEEPQELSPAEVGARAKDFTVLVECWK